MHVMKMKAASRALVIDGCGSEGGGGRRIIPDVLLLGSVESSFCFSLSPLEE